MSPSERVSSETAVGLPRVRVVFRAGVRWRVYESRLGQYDRRSRPHLFFEAEHVVRRVRSFPSRWYELEDDDLMKVAEGR